MLLSDELPEDDPGLGKRDLQSIIAGREHVLFIGITCGLSAPYVAGQLDWALTQPNIHSVALGFNPIEFARVSPCCKDNDVIPAYCSN